MAFLPITPTTSPLRVWRHPLADEHLGVPAANPAEAHEPLLVDVVTITPISSMCPDSITLGDPPAFRVAKGYPSCRP